MKPANFLKTALKDLRIPLLSVLLIGTVAMLFLPVMPIDETRYLTVAWEMKNAHSWLVPLLNGLPYSHKPPLLFWMIQAVWKLLGVHDATPRLISIFTGFISILLLYKISLRIWPEKRKTAAYAGLILGSTGFWLIWSSTIMFDILLSMWILIAVLGTLHLSESSRHGWLLLTLGLTGGLLTKGPIVFVYLLPLLLSGRYWQPDLPKKWHLMTAGACFAAIGLTLLWAVPAAISGGEEYRNAIFWEQSAGRVASSFAHRRPFWWYIPIVPLVFFPWSLFMFSLPKLRTKMSGNNLRFVKVWLIAPVVILSLISGKQIHYLIPVLPAGALLISNLITRTEQLKNHGIRLIGALYFLGGLTSFSLPFIRLGEDVGDLTPGSTIPVATGFIIVGIFLISARFKSVDGCIKSIALSTVFALLFVLCGTRNTIMGKYDVKRISNFIKTQQDQGRTVGHFGKYHGQYQFLGRLNTPLPILIGEQALDDFIIENPNAILISYRHSETSIPDSIELLSQPYRGKNVVAWSPAIRPEGKESDENPVN